MNTKALILFLILILGLVLCSFLGSKFGLEGFTGKFSGTFETPDNESSGNSGSSGDSKPKTASDKKSSGSKHSYDNYNHFHGTSSNLINGKTFYGDNGGKVVVSTNNNGDQLLTVTLEKGKTPMIFKASSYGDAAEGYKNYGTSDGDSSATFYGPNGASANVISDNGQTEIQINTGSGSYVFTPEGSYHNKDSTTSTQYYGSTGYSTQPSDYSTAYQGPNGSVSSNAYKSSYYNSNNSNSSNSSNSTGAYSSSMPPGIPKSQIPPGQEDLYILKSEIVPPVCPVCPVAASCPRQEKCPPCPACARCPEPAFECKKVPNYNAISSQYLPAPVLNDFSQFGM